MQLRHSHIAFIGFFLANIYVAKAWGTEPPSKMVIVEPNNVVTTSVEGEYKIQSYQERRPKWGKTIAVSASSYAPEDYKPDFVEMTYDQIYSKSEAPLIELQFAFKRNESTFSYGLELSAGIYQNKSDKSSTVTSSLQLIPIRLGAVVLLDAWSAQPYVSPYVSGGIYSIFYKEDNNGVNVSGNTQIAPYVSGGLQISLDWIDRKASRISYEDSGIEASYFFIEARSLIASNGGSDPDFSSAFNFAGGLKVEF